jgi:Predicted transcriptional regulator with C-terminal CBS domains
MDYKLIGTKIRDFRRFKGLTQHELAERAGMNFQSLSRIERGVNKPAYDTLKRIMDALEITPNDLLLEVNDSEYFTLGKAIKELNDAITKTIDLLDALNKMFLSEERILKKDRYKN